MKFFKSVKTWIATALCATMVVSGALAVNAFTNKNIMNENNNIVIYQSEDGKVHLDVVYNEETMWLTQQQLCDL